MLRCEIFSAIEIGDCARNLENPNNRLRGPEAEGLVGS
jgi:hypothetical protein